MQLYKYLSPERIDVLEHASIRYTQPGAFNDPFEARPFISKLTEKQEAESRFNAMVPEILKECYEEMPSSVRDQIPFNLFREYAALKQDELMAAMHSMMKFATPMVRNTIHEKLNDSLGILSLTEKPDNLLMWSHYAQSHQGFVIGFDSEHSYFDERKSAKDEFRHLRKVEYRGTRPAAPLLGLTGIDVFLVKSTQWAYEQEWRIMRDIKESAKKIPGSPYPVYLFSFPPDSINELILGCRMQEESKQHLYRLAIESGKFPRIRVFHAEPDEIEFKINLVEVPLAKPMTL